MIADLKEPSEEIKVSLLTAQDDWDVTAQQAGLDAVRNNISQTGIVFHWAFDRTQTIHARHIITDSGRKIYLDRGLDILQKFDESYFDIVLRNQKYRACKAFECTILRDKG